MNRKTSETNLFDVYQNTAQALATLIDPKILIMAAGRGTGKTTEVTAPRIIRVAASMPREKSIITHKSFVALFTNVIPAVLSKFQSDGPNGRPLMTEGIDYVVGEKDLPAHFTKPHTPMLHPERCIVFANGHVLQTVAVDHPESVAGASIVHIFMEEMKYSKADRMRREIFPALRTSKLGNSSSAHRSYLHGGITGVSDIGRSLAGEENWFLQYRDEMDSELITDIANLAIYVNRYLYDLALNPDDARAHRIVTKWQPLLDSMRKDATLFMQVSTFVNRDVLGLDYFKTMKQSLTDAEFLTSICSVAGQNRENLFFDLWDEDRHTYDDGYVSSLVNSLNLKSDIRIDASYLKDYDPTEKIVLGYDPGNFASIVSGQFSKTDNMLRIMKEFFVYPPKDIQDLAMAVNAFYGEAARFKRIDLYYDRAGNKRNERRATHTDANELKAELERFGWRVELKSLGQATIFYWQHNKLWHRLLAESERKLPKLRIDSNECPNLVSAMYCCKKIPGSSPVELDKSPEKKVPIELQAGLTPQIPSALTYLVWGMFSSYYPGIKSGETAAVGTGNFSL